MTPTKLNSQQGTIKILDYVYKPKDEEGGANEGAGNKARTSNRNSKQNRPRRRRRKRGRHVRSGYLLPYLIIPKNKQLARKIMTKLEREIAQWKISRAIHAVRRLEAFAGQELEDFQRQHMDREEMEWKRRKQKEVKGVYSKIKQFNDKIDRIRERAVKRRLKAEHAEREELYRKRYRLDPNDESYLYRPGYHKTRHRITKTRFMKSIDVTLFLEVIRQNHELLESPLWDEELNLNTLNREEVQMLKFHLQQFEVIVEALKQGLFDTAESMNPFKIEKVRRRVDQSVEPDPDKLYLRWLSKYKHVYKRKRKPDSNMKPLKRKLDFPPIFVEETEGGDFKPVGWLNLVSSWLKKTPIAGAPKKSDEVDPGKSEADPKKSEGGYKKSEGGYKKSEGGYRKSEAEEMFQDKGKSGSKTPSLSAGAWRWRSAHPLEEANRAFRRKSSVKTGVDFPASIIARLSFSTINPFSQFLTINVPKNLEKRKQFIHAIVDSKVKREPKKHQGIDADEMAQEQELRKLRVERKDPMQRLHPDDQDSDIWTKTDTTTTDDYASWRRVPDLSGKKDELDGNNQILDKTFHWRILLVLVIFWEIGVFVKRVIDDVYYSIFTFHLYRENVWLSDTRLSSPEEEYFFVSLADWTHTLISIMSLSIIKKENECVSLLFAFSSLITSVLNLSQQSYDSLILKDGLTSTTIALFLVQAVFKSLKICAFIAYHYYTADYIRKSREFRHRKTKLHNHEINAKGTKGLMKRRLAWNWMTRRARMQTLKGLKKKYPDVKDGNFPNDELEEQIKFVEAKELRLYAERHHLNLGYPYNSLKDMKRYVFGESEKSDYTGDDDDDDRLRRVMRQSRRRETDALTVDRWRRWKQEQAMNTDSKGTKRISEKDRKKSEMNKQTKSQKEVIKPLTIPPKANKEITYDRFHGNK